MARTSSVRTMTTGCCALTQLKVDNNTSVYAIKKKLREMRKNALANPEENRQRMYAMGWGETTLFVVTTPREQELEEKLKTCKFEQVFMFERRAVSKLDGIQGQLKFWIYKFM